MCLPLFTSRLFSHQMLGPADIRRRLVQASSAFGSLSEVLVDDKLSIATRRQLYNSCVLSVLLYRSECWTPLCSDLRHLDAFTINVYTPF